MVNALPGGFRTRNKRKCTAYGVTGPRLFTQGTIRDMIQSVFYTGQLRYKGSDPLPAKHPAIIDQRLFDRCQKVRL